MLAPAARACSAAPSRVLLLPGRAGAPAACAATAHLRRAGAHRRQTFTVQAAGGGGGGGAAQQWREEVTFTLPGQPIPLCCAHVKQRDMDSLFNKLGALGFEMEDGRLSQRLEDLPTEGAAVALVLPSHPPLATQRTVDSVTRGKEEELGAFLRSRASAKAQGAPITMLPTATFKDADDQDYVQLGAAVVAGSTLYVGDHRRVLGESAVLDLKAKFENLRIAKRRGVSPSLAAALLCVTHVKLFLGGEVVRAGLAVNQLAEEAALAGISVVLPSGQALGLAAEPAPAMQL